MAPPLVFGFIGCGTINSAMVRGMCRGRDAAPAVEFQERGGVWLTNRTQSKVEGLVNEFRKDIAFTVKEDVREIALACDVVVLGIRHEHFPEVLATLFSDAAVCARVAGGELYFVNMAGTIGSDGLTGMARGIAKGTGALTDALAAMFDSGAWLAKAIPLPPVQHRNGTSLLTTFVHNDAAGVDAGVVAALKAKYTVVEGVFRMLSGAADTVVQVPEAQMPIFLTITGMMGTFYQHCRVMQKWMLEKIAEQGGSDAAAAEATTRDFLVGFFTTILTDPHHGEHFEELMAAQTKGGLNEHGIEMMREDHKYEQAVPQVLDTIYGRVVKSKQK